MEPFEWLLLGIGFVVGGLFGAKSKSIVKSTAKGCLAVGEKASEWSANIREDFRDAVEEARYEREKEEEARREAELQAAHEHATAAAAAAPPKAKTSKAAVEA